jgi:hypothetical protein
MEWKSLKPRQMMTWTLDDSALQKHIHPKGPSFVKHAREQKIKRTMLAKEEILFQAFVAYGISFSL